MVANPRWHERPNAGLLPKNEGVETVNATIAHSDGGLRYFSDVGFPAHREDIYRSALAHRAPLAILRAILTLPHVVPSVHDLPDLYALAGMADFAPSRGLPGKPLAEGTPTGQG